MVQSYADRVRQAVNNEEWQEFRSSLKGESTVIKLKRLQQYFMSLPHEGRIWRGQAAWDHLKNNYGCDICVRVDNYIKALCRGGQLFPGESLLTMVEKDWNPEIKS
jgi:hypothetical protein